MPVALLNGLQKSYWKIRVAVGEGWVRLSHRVRVRVSYPLNCLTLRRARHDGRKVIMISMTAHIGDTVACEPVIRHVRAQNPDAHIIFCVRRPSRELVDTHPAVDQVVAVECITEWVRLSRKPWFDKVIDLNLHNRACPTCNVPLIKPEAQRDVTLENYFDFGSLLAAFTRSAGISVADDQPQLHIPRAAVEKVDQLGLPEQFVVLHCDSNQPWKELPATSWLEIQNQIKLPVVEVGGKPVTRAINLCGKLTILESAEVIRRACLFIGIDSGPAHLANAVGTPGIVLLGQYGRFKRYLPFTGRYANPAHAELIQHDGPALDIPVSRVGEAIDRRLK